MATTQFLISVYVCEGFMLPVRSCSKSVLNVWMVNGFLLF